MADLKAHYFWVEQQRSTHAQLWRALCFLSSNVAKPSHCETENDGASETISKLFVMVRECQLHRARQADWWNTSVPLTLVRTADSSPLVLRTYKHLSYLWVRHLEMSYVYGVTWHDFDCPDDPTLNQRVFRYTSRHVHRTSHQSTKWVWAQLMCALLN